MFDKINDKYSELNNKIDLKNMNRQEEKINYNLELNLIKKDLLISENPMYSRYDLINKNEKRYQN